MDMGTYLADLLLAGTEHCSKASLTDKTAYVVTVADMDRRDAVANMSDLLPKLMQVILEHVAASTVPSTESSVRTQHTCRCGRSLRRSRADIASHHSIPLNVHAQHPGSSLCG